MPEYVGVAGVAREVAKQYVGIDGVARLVRSGYVGVNGVARRYFDYDPTTEWVFEENGTFTVPKTGTYEVELHGGGGGGAGVVKYLSSSYNLAASGGGGGGSGMLVTVQLEKGAVINVTVGAGGELKSQGGTSKFGTYSCEGGSGGTVGYVQYSTSGNHVIRTGTGGSAAGELATSGGAGNGTKNASGGFRLLGGERGTGGCTHPDFATRGNGGAGGGAHGERRESTGGAWYAFTEDAAEAGEPGIVIVRRID